MKNKGDTFYQTETKKYAKEQLKIGNGMLLKSIIWL